MYRLHRLPAVVSLIDNVARVLRVQPVHLLYLLRCNIMVKAFKFIFCTLFFATCIFFLAAMLIPGASNVAEGGVEAPKLFDESGINQDFGDQYEEYFSKAFAFRGKVVD